MTEVKEGSAERTEPPLNPNQPNHSITTPAADLSYNEGYTYWTDFLFQGMFAATAATIISGAVAERIKISSFMLIASLYVAIVYPIVGAWKWGGGFMDAAGCYDFAGSTLVHAVGGWGALVVIYFLGARTVSYTHLTLPTITEV